MQQIVEQQEPLFGIYEFLPDLPPEILEEDGVPKPFRPLRDDNTGSLEFCEGYSDHLPVKVTLQLYQPGR